MEEFVGRGRVFVVVVISSFRAWIVSRRWFSLWWVVQVEERSLRTHLIQLESERQRLFKDEAVNGALNTPTASHLSTP